MDSIFRLVGLKLFGIPALLNPMYYIKGWPFFFKEEAWNIFVINGIFVTLSVFINIFDYVNPVWTIVAIILFRRIMAGGICTSEKRLDGQVIIITGSNTGIGKETARNLAHRGAEIVMACRNVLKAQEAANDIRGETGSKVSVMKLDLSSLDSVKKFADEIKEKYSILHCLINNAGVMGCPYGETEDGFEMQFGTNHLGHFLLTKLLLPLLKRAPSARIVTLSSMAHIGAPKDPLSNIKVSKERFDTMESYSISKLSNILFIRQLSKELKDTSIQVFSVHPGVVQSEMGRHLPFGLSFIYQHLFSLVVKTTVEGTQTTIFCATDAVQKSPHFYSDCISTAPSKLATSDELAERLWEISEDFVKDWVK